MATSEYTLLLAEKTNPPRPSFGCALSSPRGRKPQAIAHRGYKAAHPENTMGAFRGAVKVGAHAIETDVHLTKDGVVVLSHDATLKRCFGVDKKIIDCEWSYLKTLRTLKAPSQPMPRLRDLLEYLASPGLEDLWVLLDLKTDDDADDLMRLIADTLAHVKPSRPWHERVVLGCWVAKYLPLCQSYLPFYPIVHIGWNIKYARQFLAVPGVGFNMLKQFMIGPCGNRFLNDVKKARRPIFLWTVNDEPWMKRCIRKGVDGVITDDPKKFLEVCETYQGEKVSLPLRQWGGIILLNVLAMIFVLPFRYKYPFRIDAEQIAKGLEVSRERERPQGLE